MRPPKMNQGIGEHIVRPGQIAVQQDGLLARQGSSFEIAAPHVDVGHGKMGVGVARIERDGLLGRIGASRERVISVPGGNVELRRLKQDGPGQTRLRIAIPRIELHRLLKATLLSLQAFQ